MKKKKVTTELTTLIVPVGVLLVCLASAAIAFFVREPFIQAPFIAALAFITAYLAGDSRDDV